MFGRDVLFGWLVELPSVVVVEVRFDDSGLRPPLNRLLVGMEPIRLLFPVRHASLAKPVIARAKVIGMHQICHPLGSKAVGPSSRPGRSAWAKTALVEYIGDFRVLTLRAFDVLHD